MEVDDLKDLIRDIIAQEMGHDQEEEIPGEELPADDMVGAEDEEEIDLDELLREITEMSDEKKDEEVSEEVNEEEVVSEEELEEVIDDKMKHEVGDWCSCSTLELLLDSVSINGQTRSW